MSVPPREPVERLAELMNEGPVMVLTGAGVSTDSGIPDYRDDEGQWKKGSPIQFRDFVGSDAFRKRYWARSLVGWRSFADSRPNSAHRALASLEKQGRLAVLVTQNVDRLHQLAGSENVIDLHGRLDEVVCLSCRERLPRDVLQRRLALENPSLLQVEALQNPDGDAELAAAAYEHFRVVDCEGCGGLLKPDVVFFGETVPVARVSRAVAALERSRLLLIVGTSLMVYSGYRFARAATRLGIPIAVVNRGKTRADEAAALCVRGNAGEILSQIVEGGPVVSAR
jgi:NAD-dependent SIR2 family protein deacetylase